MFLAHIYLFIRQWSSSQTALFCASIILSIAHSVSQEALLEKLSDPNIGSEKGALHIVTTTECNSRYFIFQAWAQKYSLDMVQQPGKYTRIVSCDNPEEITGEDFSSMDTMFAPNWSNHPTNGDVYAPYNRPVGLMYWLVERKPTAEWTLIVDPDMLFRQPFRLEQFDIPEGYAMASPYMYLRGAMNEFRERHIPSVVPRNDTYGGHIGRKADLVGAFMLIRTKDLVKIVPLWLKYTEDVRMDPLTIKYTGYPDEPLTNKQWASEMYGYIFAAAKVNVWHKLEPSIQYYPGGEVQDIPILVHYGLNHTVEDVYYYDKHVHLFFDAARCPPWNMSLDRAEEDDGGLFPHPPFPNVLRDYPLREKYGRLMTIEFVNTINQALCKRHRIKCSPSAQLVEECDKVDAIAEALNKEFEPLHVDGVLCHDNEERCPKWAASGECEANWIYSIDNCRASCKKCRTYIPRLSNIVERHEDQAQPKIDNNVQLENLTESLSSEKTEIMALTDSRENGQQSESHSSSKSSTVQKMREPAVVSTFTAVIVLVAIVVILSKVFSSRSFSDHSLKTH